MPDQGDGAEARKAGGYEDAGEWNGLKGRGRTLPFDAVSPSNALLPLSCRGRWQSSNQCPRRLA
jgi:hypothetical protein